MPEKRFATIVASLHARSGKTLLARVLAEHFILSGGKPLIFDTDGIERRLCAAFPYDAIVVDLSRVRDQMALFDTLAKPFGAMRVVDVSHHAFEKFFRLMRDTEFVAEAKAQQVEPVILYIIDRDRESIEEAGRLRDRFADCAFVVVENAFLPRPGASTRLNGTYRALEAHELRLVMPALDPEFADVIETPGVSLSELMRQPLSRRDHPREWGDLSFDARAGVRTWLLQLFRDIHRTMQAVDSRAEALVGS